MQVNCYLLQCQILQLANIVQGKEYSADWLKGGKTVFRQGGKFASHNASAIQSNITQAVQKIGDMSDLLQKDISKTSIEAKKTLTSFFSSSGLEKVVDDYAKKLDGIEKGAGKKFNDLTKDAIKLYSQGKPEKAIKTAKPKFTDSLNAEGIELGLVAGAGLILGAPALLVSYATGASIVCLSEAMGIKEFSLENLLQVGGIAKGFKAINEGKENSEILQNFAEGGESQASFDVAIAGLALGSMLTSYALQLHDKQPGEIQINPLDLNQNPTMT